METLRNKFEKKYGVDALKMVKEASNDAYGTLKTIGINKALESYVEKKGYDFKINDDFGADLIEVMAEQQERFPENQKFEFEYNYRGDNIVRGLFATPVNPSIPKSKGVLEDFKDIVSDDDLRPAMTGVYVSEDGFLVGTDANKLVKYKNDDFSEYKGKIIDLKKYIGTKGDKIDFIDTSYYKYPQYEVVIPKDDPNNVKGLSTYAFYNLCKSAINIKKLQSKDVLTIRFSYDGSVYTFSPILFSELLAFALCKGFNTFDLSFSTPNRAFVLKFGNESLGLIMPIMSKSDAISISELTFEQVEEIYKGGGSTKSATKSTKSTQTTKEFKSEPYKKYEGKASDATYIPRREIKSITLMNGEVLGTNEIIDGIYRVKKFSHGGMLTTGYTYVDKYGLKYRYLGESGMNDGMGVFTHNGEHVVKPLSEFEIPKKTGFLGLFEEGGEVFSNEKFISYIYPKVHEIGRQNGLVVNEDLSISEGGTKFYSPNIMRMNDDEGLEKVSVYYLDDEDVIVGVISFDADDNELEMEFPMWEINIETEI